MDDTKFPGFTPIDDGGDETEIERESRMPRPGDRDDMPGAEDAESGQKGGRTGGSRRSMDDDEDDQGDRLITSGEGYVSQDEQLESDQMRFQGRMRN